MGLTKKPGSKPSVVMNKNNPTIAHKVGNSDAQDKAAAAKKKGLTTKPVKSAPLADPNLNANQQKIQGNLEQGDIGLTDARNDWVDKIGQQGDFTFNGPAAPTYDAAAQQKAEADYLAKFDRYDAPQRQKENDDLERWSQSTGNSVDSPAYMARAKQLADSQNARTEDARNQAAQQGLAQATGEFNLGQQSHNTAYGEQLDTYGRPIQMAQGVQGLLSPSWSNAQSTSDQLAQIAAQGGQQRQTQQQAFSLTHTGRGGGRRGGGMTSAPQGYTPTFMGGSSLSQPQQPSYWSQFANSIAPSAGKAIGSSLINAALNSN